MPENHRCPSMLLKTRIEVDEHTTYLVYGGMVVPIKYCPFCGKDTRSPNEENG
jgi:hypothetical protein